MIRRCDGENYSLKIDMIDIEKQDPVRQMYASLEKVVAASPEQWYFLHEHIPFVERSDDR
jgi:lauroyl/myristoyl acyltransferase